MFQGWGLYAEYLGGAGLMDVIQTDKERLGQLSFESLRAARLVVDTGMHYFKWVLCANSYSALGKTLVICCEMCGKINATIYLYFIVIL